MKIKVKSPRLNGFLELAFLFGSLIHLIRSPKSLLVLVLVLGISNFVVRELMAATCLFGSCYLTDTMDINLKGFSGERLGVSMMIDHTEMCSSCSRQGH